MLHRGDSLTTTAADLSVSELPSDWSGTGRGNHVDFNADEKIPLQLGDRLGHGADAIVYEATVHKIRVALKQISRPRKSNANVKLEIEILKKLRHRHLVRLIGSYTYKGSVGLLLYPVAVCDLSAFFEDAEAHWQDNAADYQAMRLRQLGYFSKSPGRHKAWPIYSQIGCLLSAVAYLHSQSIRHKDIKPSNILLSQGRVWLSDFGLSRDFSHLSQSGTDGGAGTVRYNAPEVADFEQSGRAADVFSLGCVLLEIMAFDEDGTLRRLRPESPTARFVYHERLDEIDEWLPWPTDLDPLKHQLCLTIRSMLSRFPKQRPRIDDLVSRLGLSDTMVDDAQDQVFPACCRVAYFTKQQSDSRVKALQLQIVSLRQEVRNLQTHGRLIDPGGQDRTDSGNQRQVYSTGTNTPHAVPSPQKPAEDETVSYYSPRLVDSLVGIIIAIIYFILLLVPTYALYKRTFNAIAMLVLLSCCLPWLYYLILLMRAKRHELSAMDSSSALQGDGAETMLGDLMLLS